jgi:hypothetical protein
MGETVAEGLEKVKAMLPPVITLSTRVDDALAPEFIERVQAVARAETRPGSFVISFEPCLKVLLRSRPHRRRVWAENQRAHPPACRPDAGGTPGAHSGTIYVRRRSEPGSRRYSARPPD